MPSSFGDYEILEELGFGGMAVTFKARVIRGPHAGRLVCLKVVAHKPWSWEPSSQRALKALRREAAIVAKFEHPCLTRLLDVGRHKGQDFLALELVDGADLRKVLRLHAPLETSCVWSIATDGASALAYAHAQDVLHRDIKPANLMVSRDGQIRFVDFGLGKLNAAQARMFSRGVGTPRYSALEQLRDENLSPRADIYSFGVVLFEALTGCHPYKGDEDDDKKFCDNLCRGRIQHDLRDYDVPQKLAAIVRRCIDVDPANRFEDGQFLRAALRSASPVIADGRLLLGAMAASAQLHLQSDPFDGSSGFSSEESSAVGA